MSDLLVYSALITCAVIVVGIIFLKLILSLLKREKDVDLDTESRKSGRVVRVSSPETNHEALQRSLQNGHSHGHYYVTLLDCGYLSNGIWYGLPNATMPSESISSN